MSSSSRRVVLVTGCSEGGIGEALCLELLRRGWAVVATSRLVATVEPLRNKVVSSSASSSSASQEGKKEEKEKEKEVLLDILPLDITDEGSIRAAVDHTITKYGKLDMLINNAGFAVYGPVIEVDPEAALQNYNTNVVGVLRVCKAVVPHMVRQGHGKIVNIGSVSGIITTPFSAVYGSTKAALHAMSDGLRMELKPFGIDVVVIAPGSIRTSFGLKGNKPPKVNTSSLYSAISEQIYDRTLLSTKPTATSVDEFARVTVAEITRRRPAAYFYYGAFSLLGRLARMFLPWWFLDWALQHQAGLNGLKQKLLTTGKEKSQ